MSNDVAQTIAETCRRYDISDLYVFGSRSREIAGRLRNERVTPGSDGSSDVDIGVLPVQPWTFGPEERVNLTIELEDLFQVQRVDLVVLPEADPYLALDVIRGELLYTRDPDQQARYELFVLRRAGDLLPYKKARIRMIMEEGAR